ncbi:MAG: protein kinase, partial [Myxococcales bacterium]|nr:protein kinase [Myxococcales bacterium]
MSFSRGDCIDANLAATFLEGALPEAEASAIRDHLDECDECCELLAMAAHETPGEAAAPTPARLSRVRIGADLPTASVGGVDTILDRNARPTRWLLAPGQRVDHFRVVRPIGRGGMSEVYLARDLSLGRRVALKVLHVQAATSAGVERLLAEARAIARFNHPNIVTIYGAGEQGTLPYVALEYVQGSSLGLRLRQGPLGHVEALRVGMAIAQALAEAHAHDILHRDLKPDNVMLARDGRVRVVDFGLAQVRPSAAADGAEVDHDGDAPRHVAGTPPYMAPELLRTDRVGPGVDIWAFGVVMLEMLGAPRPYEGCDWSERSAKLRDIRPVPLPPELDRLPVELRRLVASCLDKDVEKRPDARKLAQALGRALQSGLAAEALPLAPFLGLRAFRERDQALFFGRADEIAECVERLARQALLPLVGPSGAGKSSLVHAGVVPRLREQEPWQLVTMTPTASPIATLAAALFAAAREVQSHAPPSHGELSGPRGRSLLGTVGGQLPAVAREQLGRWLRETPTLLGLWLDELASAAGESVLLVVDQLEEVVTLCEDGDERRAFIDAVCLAAEDVAEPVRVIVTLREEFLSRLAAGSAATRALGAALIVRPPDAAALELTLTRPLSLFGFAFEDPDLPRRMVAEIGGALACLPLLSFTAELLWDRRDLEAHELPTAAYQEIGGVVGALAHHAEGVIAALDDSERRLARELLLKLVTAEGTRRRVARAELLSGLETVDDSSSSGAEQVLARLLEARLLVAVSDEDEQQVIELMHESLAVQWARLRRWIADGREDLRLFDDATQAAALWRRQGEPSSQLWSGDALARVAALLEARGSKVGAPAADEEHVSRGLRAFVAASIARERSQRVRRAALVSVTIAASLAIAIVSV